MRFVAAARVEPVLAGCCGLACLVAAFLTGYAGTLGALAFVLSWLPYVAVFPRRALSVLTRGPGFVIWMIPVLALASIAWSDSAAATAWYGVQLAVTVAVAVLLARLVPPARLLLLLAAAVYFVAGLCLTIGLSSIDPFTGAVSYIGIFGSKNQFGLLIVLLILTSTAICLGREQPAAFRLGAMLALPVAVPLLVQSRSAGAYATVVVALTALLGAYVLARQRPVDRALLILGGSLIVIPLLGLAVFAGDAFEFVVGDLLQRDTTLTGRTELWDYARGLIAGRPWLGTGFAAFWQAGNADADLILRKFYVTEGFNFHNGWLDIAVQLGYPGMALLTLAFAAAMGRCIAWTWRAPSFTSSFFAAESLQFCFRAYFEVEVPVAFHASTLLFFTMLVVGVDSARTAPASAR